MLTESPKPEFQCVLCGTIAEGEGPVCGSPACQARAPKADVVQTVWGEFEVGFEGLQ